MQKCLHKQTKLGAYKCLKVTKSKPNDNQSQTAIWFKLQPINNFLSLLLPFFHKSFSPTPVFRVLLTISNLVAHFERFFSSNKLLTI